ncbi:MAG TPA: hypothetical protein VFA50_00045 [Stellaceae bacterium]|nr:hypothetical protein [Stellaceae bacterium]
MVLAAFIWIALGVVLSYAAHHGDDTIAAEGGRLSTIAPAAGPQQSALPANNSAGTAPALR